VGFIQPRPGPKSPKILLQICDGLFQIGTLDQACREHERRHFIVANVRRISAFAGELRTSTASDYRKYPIYVGISALSALG
jgi:hypothetical protein